MDSFSKIERSALMSRVKHVDTEPELVVRRALHRRGLRYVLADRRLPGKPDLVFPRHKAVVFVHGCFWHGHSECTRGRPSASNTEYWAPKITANKARDNRNERALRDMGWRVFVVWACEIRSAAGREGKMDVLAKKIFNPATIHREQIR